MVPQRACRSQAAVLRVIGVGALAPPRQPAVDFDLKRKTQECTYHDNQTENPKPLEGWHDGNHANDVCCDQKLEPEQYPAPEIRPIRPESAVPFTPIHLLHGPHARGNHAGYDDCNPEDLHD